VLISATTTSQPAFSRSSRIVSRFQGTRIASVTAASPIRPRMSVAGDSSRTATLMNMKDEPQIRARARSIARFRRELTSPCNARPAPSVSRATMHYLTQVAEQPLHRALGLTDWEADRIRELLGRDANHFELAVFSLLWSEHCGYKHSAPLLKRLPSAGDRVLQGPGENAGVLDLGDGLAVA